jgi:hypothetical protein
MNKKIIVASDVSEMIQAASEGNFEIIFGDDVEDWWSFVRERLNLGTDELMIRLDLEDPVFGKWSIWLVFSVEVHGRALAFEEILIPDYENEPESAQAIPLGREKVPYFVLS